jgi:hypothetical protein
LSLLSYQTLCARNIFGSLDVVLHGLELGDGGVVSNALTIVSEIEQLESLGERVKSMG